MIRFRLRIENLIRERGLTLFDIEDGCGVRRQTVYRGIKTRSSIAALAYFFGMTAEELVDGTDLSDLWYRKDENK